MKLAVLGIGSVRCAPPVISSLSGYFGERDLEIQLWDSDYERLDLFDRFARLCFQITRAKHALSATDDSAEALDGANGVLLMVGENCARRFLRQRGSLLGHGETPPVLVQRCVAELLTESPLEAQVLSLITVEQDGHRWRHIDWPAPLSEADRRAAPHQILRYIFGEDYPHALLDAYRISPVTEWLDAVIAS